MSGCYLRLTPNEWGCHDPQCNDSTWDHECPTGPCTVPAHQADLRFADRVLRVMADADKPDLPE